MTTKTKLVILELVGGIFGWGWLIAAAAALYFLVMVAFFEGAWTPVIVALVVSTLSKWLARGIEDHKRRVAFEADMVAKGLSPDEAREAWLKAYTGEGGSPADIAEKDH